MTDLISSKSLALILVATLVVATGCSDQLFDPEEIATETDEIGSYSESTYGALQDVRPVQMDLPAAPRAIDIDNEALRDSIRANDGIAIVAFKPPGEEPTLEADGRRPGVPSEVFANGLRLVEQKGIEVKNVLRSIGAAVIEMDPELAGPLRNHQLVDYVEPRQTYELTGVKSERALAYTASSSSQTIPWGIEKVNAPHVWHKYTGSGVKVQVIDTGMENHADLPDRPEANCGGEKDGDGCEDGPIYHGTHVSGTLMALDNSFGVVGVSPGIHANDTYSWAACSPYTGECSSDMVAAGIDAGVYANVDIINMSLGGGYHASTANSVAIAWSQDIVLVAAAGNNEGNTIRYPANYSEVVGVSGITEDGSFADTSPCPLMSGGYASSNWGSHVDIAGPFWALSTVGTNSYEDENDDWCGTSMATPHVSGAAALLREANPSWSNQQIVDQLLNTADHPSSATRDDYYGHGILDVAAALDIAPDEPIEVTVSGPSNIYSAGNYTWDANTSNEDGPVSYQWSIFYHDSGQSQNLGTSSSQSYFVNESTGSFTISVEVSDNSSSDTDSQIVFNFVGCDSGTIC